jgi:hypothetical protein
VRDRGEVALRESALPNEERNQIGARSEEGGDYVRSDQDQISVVARVLANEPPRRGPRFLDRERVAVRVVAVALSRILVEQIHEVVIVEKSLRPAELDQSLPARAVVGEGSIWFSFDRATRRLTHEQNSRASLRFSVSFLNHDYYYKSLRAEHETFRVD